MHAESELVPTIRTAVITGAARGIGFATAKRLAADGHRVVLVDLDAVTLERASGEIPGSLAYRCDITDPTEPDGAFREAEAVFGPVDILVNNAGIVARTATIEDQSDDDWHRSMSVLLTAPFRWSRAAVPVMKSRGWGRIINVASVAGKEGNPNIIPYSVAKAGLIGLTKALAKETATSGVLVNAVAPAVVETDLLQDVAPKMVEYMVSRIPMGRLGRPEEVASAISWLASEESTVTTGQVLDLSGGRSTY
jgi:NAD(P)-dependent dehydrogenase (short-subunit alcohol dehydrogenase family)